MGVYSQALYFTNPKAKIVIEEHEAAASIRESYSLHEQTPEAPWNIFPQLVTPLHEQQILTDFMNMRQTAMSTWNWILMTMMNSLNLHNIEMCVMKDQSQ